MKIRFEKINKKQVYDYAELAPVDILNKARLEGTVTVIAYVSDDEKLAKTDNGRNAADIGAPAGMMQYSISDSGINLNWIYVYSRYRNQGVGTELIEMLSDIPESSQSTVKAKIYDHMMAEMPIEVVRSFLINRGFADRDPEEGMYFMTAKYIFRNMLQITEDEITALNRNVVSFSRYTPDMLMKLAKETGQQDPNSILSADKNLSFLFETSRVYEGVLMCEKAGDRLYVNQVRAASDSEKEKLLKVFFYNLRQKLKYSDMVIISDTTVDEQLLGGLFPNIKNEDAFLLIKEK